MQNVRKIIMTRNIQTAPNLQKSVLICMATVKSVKVGALSSSTEIILISGFIRIRVAILESWIDPQNIYKIIQQFYRKALLIELIANNLTQLYDSSIVAYLQNHIAETKMTCRQIYSDITSKSLESNIINNLCSQFIDVPKGKLHDELRNICYGKKKSQFNHGATQYLYYIKECIVSYTRSDGELGYKIDFEITSLTEKFTLEILIFLYQFAQHWMYGYNNQRRKRNKLEACLNKNIQHIFENIDVIIIPSKVVKLFIEDKRVNQSCYYVRNILNQFLKNTFVPLCV
eukprot:455104_1